MNVDIKYSIHIDLIFHVLAYMHVNNASDCFDQAYIDSMKQEKASFDFDILSELKLLEKYYNDNFERVMLINFLPFCCRSFEEMKEVFLGCSYFTAEDKNSFIEPFISLLEKEAAFYFDYWQRKYDSIQNHRLLVENYLKKELNKYSCIFDHFEKSALAYLSFSITRNGRGIGGIGSYFSAIAPFPNDEMELNNTFFTLLHEFTHQFTDDLLRATINMNDDSHNISENIAILADYYLIKSIDYHTVEKYLKWIAYKCNDPLNKLNELEFLDKFKVEENLNSDLKVLINSLLK